MYHKLEPQEERDIKAEAQAESQCSCTCKAPAKKDSTETPTISQATLYDVDYYDIGGK